MQLSKKVQENRISEKEYRNLLVMSYSMYKAYDNSREDFYREYIIRDKKKDKTSNAIVLGSLVHCLLANLGDFDDKFHINSAKIPKPQMLKLCENLFIRYVQSLNEFDEQQDNFNIIFTDAVQRTKYNFNQEEVEFKGKDEKKILELFEGSDAELYFKELIENRTKTVITIPQVEQAERLVQKVREDEITAWYVNVKTIAIDEVRDIKGIEVFSELPIEFEINGVKQKCMPDKLIVDHINQVVKKVDWKCSWDNESPENQYLKYGYYLQAALYEDGVGEWMKQHGIGHYKQEEMIFIFIDTQGFNRPVDFRISQDDLNRAKRGFSIRGKKYKGLSTLQKEIEFHVNTGIWNTSLELHESKGILKAKIPYGSR